MAGRLVKVFSFQLVVLLIMALLAGPAMAGSSGVTGHWAEEAFGRGVDKGWIVGYQDGTFRPDDGLTRAEFTVMVNRALGFTEEDELVFADVREEAWYAEPVKIASAAGYISGYEDGSFRPEAEITRLEAVAIVAALMNNPAAQAPIATFVDADEIPDWGKAAVNKAVDRGVIKGYADNTFRPQRSLSRAEGVAILDQVRQLEFASRLYLDQEKYYPDDTIHLVTENQGAATLYLGHPFGVERLVGGEWVGVTLDLTWIMVLEMLEGGEQLAQSFVPKEAFKDQVPEAGYYRVHKEVEYAKTGEKDILTAQFEIVSAD